MVVEFYRYFGVRLGANFLEPRARPAPRAHAGAGLCPNAFTSTHPGTREARWSLAETGRAPAAHILDASRSTSRSVTRIAVKPPLRALAVFARTWHDPGSTIAD